MKSTHIVLSPDSKDKLTKNFNASEVVCSCGSCHASFINLDLMEKLQKLRDEYNAPIAITSGYRCPEHNRKIGGASKSQHVLGNGIDITGQDLDKLYELGEKYFKAVGDGRPKGFVHLDSRDDKTRRWVY